jgi:hypothetical protein
VRTQPSVRRILCALGVLNLLGWCALWLLQGTVRQHQGLSVAFKSGAGVPVGYLADNLYYGGIDHNDKCVVVRYVSAGCSYCRLETATWNQLAARATGAGCALLGVVPDAVSLMRPGAYGAGAKTQMVFANMEWVSAFPPVRTPTTMIFDSHARLVWQHVGQLTERQVTEAQSVFRRLQ